MKLVAGNKVMLTSYRINQSFIFFYSSFCQKGSIQDILEHTHLLTLSFMDERLVFSNEKRPFLYICI